MSNRNQNRANDMTKWNSGSNATPSNNNRSSRGHGQQNNGLQKAAASNNYSESIQRSVANPKYFQTHVAKISYDTKMQTAWQGCTDSTPRDKSIGHNTHNQRDFQDAKKIAGLKAVPFVNAECSERKDNTPFNRIKKINLNVAPIRRGHTEIELSKNIKIDICHSGRNKTQTEATMPKQRSQSCEPNKKALPPICKRAAIFLTKENVKKSECEKERIKKRLEELNKNSKRLLKKNLQKKNKENMKSVPKITVYKEIETPAIASTQNKSAITDINSQLDSKGAAKLHTPRTPEIPKIKITSVTPTENELQNSAMQESQNTKYSTMSSTQREGEPQRSAMEEHHKTNYSTLFTAQTEGKPQRSAMGENQKTNYSTMLSTQTESELEESMKGHQRTNYSTLLSSRKESDSQISAMEKHIKMNYSTMLSAQSEGEPQKSSIQEHLKTNYSTKLSTQTESELEESMKGHQRTNYSTLLSSRKESDSQISAMEKHIKMNYSTMFSTQSEGEPQKSTTQEYPKTNYSSLLSTQIKSLKSSEITSNTMSKTESSVYPATITTLDASSYKLQSPSYLKSESVSESVGERESVDNKTKYENKSALSSNSSIENEESVNSKTSDFTSNGPYIESYSNGNLSSKGYCMSPPALDMPSMKLTVFECSSSNKDLQSNKSSLSRQLQSSLLSDNEYLPFWLRPSAIHVYPYNFVFAVRRKLESLMNPAFFDKTDENLQYENNLPNMSKQLEINDKTTSVQSFINSQSNQNHITTNINDNSLALSVICSKEPPPTSDIVEKSEERQLRETYSKLSPKQLFKYAKMRTSSQSICKTNSMSLICTSNESAQTSKTPSLCSNQDNEQSNPTFTSTNTRSMKYESIYPKCIKKTDKKISLSQPTTSIADGMLITSKSSYQNNCNTTSLKKSNTTFDLEAPTTSLSKLLRKSNQQSVDEDETTISSSVFNSPEKKLNSNQSEIPKELTSRSPSPLSVGNIREFRVSTKNKLKEAIANRNIETKRGNDLSNQSTDLNIYAFLRDFNNSLTQAMQLNEKLKHKASVNLKTQIDDSQKDNSERTTYDDDFEKLSDELSKTTAMKSSSSQFEKENNTKTYSLSDKDKYKTENSKKINSIAKTSQKSYDTAQSSTQNKDVITEGTQNFKSITIRFMEKDKFANMENKSENEFKLTEISKGNEGDIESNFAKDDSLTSEFVISSSVSSSRINGSEKDRILQSNQYYQRYQTEVQPSIQSTKSWFTNKYYKGNLQTYHTNVAMCGAESSSTPNSMNQSKLRMKVNEDTYQPSTSSACMNGNKSSNESNNPMSNTEFSPQSSYSIHNSFNVNTNRGDFINCEQQITNQNETSTPHSQNGKMKSNIENEYNYRSKRYPSILTSPAMESEMIAIFDKNNKDVTPSEYSMSYSSVGLYDKLINVETTKSEHLTALLKIREKVLLDRAKSQITWLEVQKERYKAQGLLMHIAAIKKKQRAILIKMRKEREDIKRLLVESKAVVKASSSSSAVTPGRCHQGPSVYKTESGDRVSSAVRSKRSRQRHISTTPILRGDYTIETSRSLEELLQRREQDLSRRRQYVERLMEWHQRLDKEEAEVLQLEHMLIDSNNVFAKTKPCNVTKLPDSALPPRSYVKNNESSMRKLKMQRRLKEIDNSLHELSTISSSSYATGEDNSTDTGVRSVDYVCTNGAKLNKLWRRLTSQRLEKFESMRRYKLSKVNLEQLYEDAKETVLNDLVQIEDKEEAEEEEEEARNSLQPISYQLTNNKTCNEIENKAAQDFEYDINIEPLNLSNSSTNDDSNSDQSLEDSKRYAYCPCEVEVDFTARRNSDNTETDTLYTAHREIVERNNLIERNIQKFVTLTKNILTQHTRLQRSVSDNQISLSVGSESLNSGNSTSVSCKNLPALDLRAYQDESATEESKSYDLDDDESYLSEVIVVDDRGTENATNGHATDHLPSLSNSISNSVQQEAQGTALDADEITNISMPEWSKAEDNSMSGNEEHYEADFENISSGSMIEDESMPLLETTIDISQSNELSILTYDGIAGESAIALNESKNLATVSTSPNKVNASKSSTIHSNNYNNNANESMPSIINNINGRSNQLLIPATTNELQSENGNGNGQVFVPYIYMREIPNKPPPPYVPPAPGSPMTTIFPSEERIRDITFRRTHELYCQHSNIEYGNGKGEKLPSVMDEKITNIYERIILDICREYIDDHKEVLEQGDPANFYSQLAFFNPPDRLRCIQNTIYKEIRRCLAMNKQHPKSNHHQVYSIYGQRARRDHIGTIIVQEMYEEDDQWCNFRREENEVLELMFDEMISMQVQMLVKEAWLEKFNTPTSTAETAEAEKNESNQNANANPLDI